MENKRILYDFCPACSGLMKNGVCIACGYEKDRTQEDGLPAGNVKRPEAAMSGGGAAAPGRTVSSGSNVLQKPAHGKLAGLAVGLGIAAVALILCIALYLIARDVAAGSPQSREAAAEEAEPEASGSRLPFSTGCCSLPSV